MQELISEELKGRISVTSADGRSGIVTLDTPYQGLKYAVISPDTRGRIAMMSQTKDGKLPEGKEVVIKQSTKGSEALLAVEVAAA